MNHIEMVIMWQWACNRGWGLLSHFPPSPLFSQFFIFVKTLVIHRVEHLYLTGAAVVTPVKYECDSKDLIGLLAKSVSYPTEKLTNRALVIPTAGNVVQRNEYPPNWGPNKMDSMMQMTFENAFKYENVMISNYILLKYLPWC